MKKTISYENPVNVVRNICSSLHKNGYQWNIDRLKPTPIDLYMDMTKLVDYYTLHKLKKKNVEAMAKTMAEQDLGILFITNAVTLLDKSKEPIGTKLGCTKNSEILDVSYMAKAIEEAEYNITQYIIRVGSKFKEAKYDVKLTNSLVEYFVQTNHTASIEATSSYPQGIGWILKSLAELDQNARSREKVDNIVTWGGAILGIGLTLTGVGAPEGVSIMIAAVGVVKGIAAGTYFVIRASEEREFAKEIQLSKNGGGGVSDANLKKHYSDYKQLKILYIKEFGQSALNFVNLHRMCMNRTGDVGKAHSILRRVFETAKDTGKETAIETLQDLVLNAAVAG
jgi:hypothetical protein